MNKYFRTIGFLDISTRRILEKAVNKSIADYMNNQDKQPSRIVEIEIECHEHFGVMIHGECIDEEDFYVDYIIPFVRSKNYYSYINAKEENAVQMDSFFIRATFGKMNTELTFFVENSLDYVKERKNIGKKMVGLVGMAKQGEILMPVVPYNPKEDEKIEKSDDILSIVETSIFPEGIQSGRYSVLGIIEECELCQNKITLENVYYFTIKCKDIRINVVINEKNLQGVPEVGRRFAGEIWLQGNTHVVNI